MKREIEGLEMETGQVDSSAEQMKQIEVLSGELATLRKKYSAEHPDVVSLERRIKALEANPPVVNNSSSLASSAADNPDNPAYIQIQTQIEAAETRYWELRLEVARLESPQRVIRAAEGMGLVYPTSRIPIEAVGVDRAGAEVDENWLELKPLLSAQP